MDNILYKNPNSLPAAHRAWMYDNILLRWETKEVKIRKDNFRKKFVADVLGMNVVQKKKLSDVEAVYSGASSFRNVKNGFITFYVNGKGYESLFKRLRDVVAHGDYWSSRRGWISFEHRYSSRGNTNPELRIFGSCRFNDLKKLIHFLDDLLSRDEHDLK